MLLQVTSPHKTQVSKWLACSRVCTYTAWARGVKIKPLWKVVPAFLYYSPRGFVPFTLETGGPLKRCHLSSHHKGKYACLGRYSKVRSTLRWCKWTCVTVCVRVCTCLNVFVRTKNWHATIFVGTNSYLWGSNVGPHKFEGIFEAENVALRVRVRLCLCLGQGVGVGVGLGMYF